MFDAWCMFDASKLMAQGSWGGCKPQPRNSSPEPSSMHQASSMRQASSFSKQSWITINVCSTNHKTLRKSWSNHAVINHFIINKYWLLSRNMSSSSIGHRIPWSHGPRWQLSSDNASQLKKRYGVWQDSISVRNRRILGQWIRMHSNLCARSFHISREDT